MIKTITLALLLFTPQTGWMVQEKPMDSIDQCVDAGIAHVENLKVTPDTLGWQAAFGCKVEIASSI